MKTLALYGYDNTLQFQTTGVDEDVVKFRNGLIKKIKESGCEVEKVKNETEWEIYGEQWKSSTLVEEVVEPEKLNIDDYRVENSTEGLWVID